MQYGCAAYAICISLNESSEAFTVDFDHVISYTTIHHARSIKTCHFVLDYKSCISWQIFTFFVPTVACFYSPRCRPLSLCDLESYARPTQQYDLFTYANDGVQFLHRHLLGSLDSRRNLLLMLPHTHTHTHIHASSS